ncbi:hypothetical protein SFRURICE_012896 [Spodoptera frugiperda]|nr:hypothetical protein SFRURICE_012896 [Spodoptera frugiperda]
MQLLCCLNDLKVLAKKIILKMLAAAAAAAAGATSELSYLAALHPAYRPVPYDHPLYGANTLRVLVQ